jgi:hypothetical protein
MLGDWDAETATLTTPSYQGPASIIIRWHLVCVFVSQLEVARLREPTGVKS